MDLPAIERSLRAAEPSAVLADERLVRRVIKRHRHLPGLGLQVPHARCYAIGRDALLAIVAPAELGRRRDEIPEEVILLPRPDPGSLVDSTADVLADLWRSAFHARVHLAIERRIAEGKLTDARIRRRIHAIGETEFDEIRLVLRSDDLLLPPHDDREAYTEFAALYLELRGFAPERLHEMFPTLEDQGAVEATLAEDVDAERLLEACRPQGAAERAPPSHAKRGAVARRPSIEERLPAPIAAAEVEVLLAVADGARAKGNVVRSALLRLQALHAAGDRAEAIGAAAQADIDALAARIARTLRPRGNPHAAPGEHVETAEPWTAPLLALAKRAAAGRGLFRRVEARLLYDLQNACLADERALGKVDLVEWALSLGRRPLARLLPATGEIRVARALRDASEKVAQLRVAEPLRERLDELCTSARRRADENIRDALRPAVTEALTGVGFRPSSGPERVALAKVVEELLDQAILHGFLSLGPLRDALSRNQLKMPDLSGPRQLVSGDAILAADRGLSVALDGVYRRGEIYLRGLQRLSSLLFGTRTGRALALYLLLPFGAAFVLLEGVEHIVNPVAGLLGLIPGSDEMRVIASATCSVEAAALTGLHGAPLGVIAAPLAGEPQAVERLAHRLHQAGEIHFLGEPSIEGGSLPARVVATLAANPLYLITAALIFGLMHSARVRAAGKTVAHAFAWVFVATVFHVPRWLLALPFVQWVLGSRLARIVRRHVVRPGLATLLVHYATPLRHAPRALSIAALAGVFVLANLAFNSRAGILAEELTLDALDRAWRRLRRQVLPGLLRLITDIFRRFTDTFDRAFYAVDEWLRFHQGQGRAALAGKAILGVVWFAFAYVLRVYVNIFLEPTFNPIKHFPVVTVAAKLMIPVTKTVAEAVKDALAGTVGSVAALALAGLTVASMPGVFGFLVWEFKENYRLYKATRAPHLRPVSIGHHGETMEALMKPGFHSGTLPKLYAKLRRAAKKGDASTLRHEEALRELEEAVTRFVDREISTTLRESARWKGGAVSVARVELASNRVRVELARGAAEACCVDFEEQSGWLVASVHRAGFLSALGDEDRVLFENALAGLYQLAGVDLVREQIAAILPGSPPYDVSNEGLVVWPEVEYDTEVVYALDGGPALAPKVRGVAPRTPPAALDRRALLFREQPIAWDAWIAAWSGGASKRVLPGPSILPALL